MYDQLVQPNLSAVGQVGYCLAFAEDVFGAPHIYTTPPNNTAAYAWSQAKYKHLDQNFPTDAAVLLWWNYKNAGHVAVNVPGQGILSSPWQQGTTHAWLPSVAELERIYSDNGTYPLIFLGWSEDIANVRVAQPQGEDMTKEQATQLSLYLRLLAGETVDQANTHAADDVSHMLADPGYAAAVAQQLYNGEWQPFAWKATHYDALAQTAASNASNLPTVTVNGQPWGPVQGI